MHGHLQDDRPVRPLLMVDIDGVISLFGGDGSPARAAPGGRLLPLDRGHTALPFGHRGRSPACARRSVRPGLGERLGGEGRRTPPPPARPARRAAPPALRARGRAQQRPLEARGDRRYAGRRPLAWIDDALRRRLPRLGGAPARRRRCSSRPTRGSGSPAARPSCWCAGRGRWPGAHHRAAPDAATSPQASRRRPRRPGRRRAHAAQVARLRPAGDPLSPAHQRPGASVTPAASVCSTHQSPPRSPCAPGAAPVRPRPALPSSTRQRDRASCTVGGGRRALAAGAGACRASAARGRASRARRSRVSGSTSAPDRRQLAVERVARAVGRVAVAVAGDARQRDARVGGEAAVARRPPGSTRTVTLPPRGTPCSESFHASRRSSAAARGRRRSARRRTLPSTATPVETRL